MTETRAGHSCRSCRFWEISSQDVRAGECRVRRPEPFVTPTPDGELRTARLFPVTTGADWCGEHSPRLVTS